MWDTLMVRFTKTQTLLRFTVRTLATLNDPRRGVVTLSPRKESSPHWSVASGLAGSPLARDTYPAKQTSSF